MAERQLNRLEGLPSLAGGAVILRVAKSPFLREA